MIVILLKSYQTYMYFGIAKTNKKGHLKFKQNDYSLQW